MEQERVRDEAEADAEFCVDDGVPGGVVDGGDRHSACDFACFVAPHTVGDNRQTALAQELFVILRGEAAVTRGGRKLSTLGPGDFFGEMALLSRGERTATVTARTDMRVLLVGPRHLEDVLSKEPSMAKPMLEVMARRVRASERSHY